MDALRTALVNNVDAMLGPHYNPYNWEKNICVLKLINQVYTKNMKWVSLTVWSHTLLYIFTMVVDLYHVQLLLFYKIQKPNLNFFFGKIWEYTLNRYSITYLQIVCNSNYNN